MEDVERGKEEMADETRGRGIHGRIKTVQCVRVRVMMTR